MDQPAIEVRRQLLGPPERWLPSCVVSSLGERRYLARVGFDAGIARVAKQVELTLGEPEAPGLWLVVPVAWRATGVGQLFPVLDGKLTVHSLGSRSSTLWMGAHYQPPLGPFGRELDAVALHNVAAATVRDFVEGIAARLAVRVQQSLAHPRPALARGARERKSVERRRRGS